MPTMRFVPLLAAVLMPAMLWARVSQGQICRWTDVSTSKPSARYGHALVYAESAGMSILFGGNAQGQPTNETWGWDGVGWTLFPDQGPPPRYSHAMAYDSFRRVIVLFGGYDGDDFGDTWEWDGEEWVLVSENGPSPRRLACMAYDTRRRVMVLFGGYHASNRLGDTWEWNGVNWIQVAQSGPRPRHSAAMACDELRSHTVLFGGDGADTEDVTWTWDGVSWQSITSQIPPRRYSHAMVYDRDRGTVFLYAGLSEGNHMQDSWSWNGTTWTLVSPQGPPARFQHAMAYHPIERKMVLFGGIGQSGRTLGDTWTHECMTTRSLRVDATCPGGGPVSVTWSGFTQSGRVALLFSLVEGAFRVPPGYPCVGLELGLGSGGLQVVWSGRSNAIGGGTLQSIAGGGACLRFLQMIDLDACATSDVALIQ